MPRSYTTDTPCRPIITSSVPEKPRKSRPSARLIREEAARCTSPFVPVSWTDQVWKNCLVTPGVDGSMPLLCPDEQVELPLDQAPYFLRLHRPNLQFHQVTIARAFAMHGRYRTRPSLRLMYLNSALALM